MQNAECGIKDEAYPLSRFCISSFCILHSHRYSQTLSIASNWSVSTGFEM
jgi:hypothetical protein